MKSRIPALFLLFVLIAFSSGTIVAGAMPETSNAAGIAGPMSDILNFLHHIFGNSVWLWSNGAIYSSTSSDSQINGTVTDSATHVPIENVTITVNSNHTQTDANGRYEIQVAAGNHTVMAMKTGYQNESQNVAVANNQTVTVNFNLTRLAEPMGWIEGKVTDANTTLPIQEANITANGQSAMTNSTGDYKLQVKANATYNVTASKEGYLSKTAANVTVVQDQITTTNFTLTPVTKPPGMGSLKGNVTDAVTGKPLAGAVVMADGQSETTNDSGLYEFTLSAGLYNVTASKAGYTNQTATGIMINENMTTVKNFALTPIAVTPMKVMLSIHPESLNLESNGRWITVSVEFPSRVNMKDINISSIRLNDTIHVDPAGPIELLKHNGITELTFKVSRESVEKLIMKNDGQHSKFGKTTLVLTGMLTDKTLFRGIATIKTILNEPKSAI